MSLTLFRKVSIIWLVFLIGLSGLWNNFSIVQQAHAAAAEPYLGEIRLFPYSAIPTGWMPARGQTLPLTQNTALYALLGNKYGGDGKSTFALPNLTNAAPEGMGYYIAMNGIFPPRDADTLYTRNAVLGEVRLFPYFFSPTGWLTAEGQSVNRSEYSDLYEMIGTTYGSDTPNDFKLPNFPEINGVHYAIFTNPANHAENGTGNEYIGEIIPMLVSLSTKNWILADGSTLATNDNQPLFSLLGTKFGGNGSTEFKVPNLNSSQSDLVYYVANAGAFPSLDGGQLPEAIEDTYTTNQNSTLTESAPGVLSNDSDGSTAILKSGPMNGTLVLNANGAFTYTPNANYVGSDSFTYSANNPWGTSIPVLVTIMIGQTTPPIVNGVSDGGIYNQTVTPTFNSGTAFLNGAAFANGTPVTADGVYTLVVTNSIGSTTLNFSIDTAPPVVLGVTDNGKYNENPTITFNEGTATLNGSPFSSGETVQSEGEYALIVTDRAGNTTTLHFSFYTPRTINFNSNGGSEVNEQTVSYGDKVIVPAVPTRAGYTFAGWYTDSGLSQAFDFGNTTVTADITLYAKWTVNSYTVNFDPNGGSVVADQTVPYGELATAPDVPTKAGYTFGGWYTDSGLRQAFDFDNTTVTNDITLYAKWTVNSYTVHFASNGGSVVADQSIQHGDLAAAPDIPTKTGHTFGGWYTDSGLSQAFDFDNTTVTTDITLYAKWTVNSYTVNFDSNGGTVVADQTVQYGELATAPDDPIKAGHTFAGWYHEPELSTPFDLNTASIVQDTTLYAKWAPNTYTVTFNTLGGSAVSDAAVEYEKKLSAPASPSRSGYTFAGWYTDPELKTPFNFAQTVITADLTLYAKWGVNSTPPSGGSGGNSSGGSGNQNNNGSSGNPSPPNTTNSSNNGRLTLTAGQAGQVSLGGSIAVSIPAGAMNQELRVTIEQIADPSALLTHQIQLLSPVYELLKNVPQNFNVPVTLTLTFDLSSLQRNQRAELFYFDEQDKAWLSAGKSSVNGNQIRVDVDHFTKFAVLAVDQPKEPTEILFNDVEGHWAKEVIQQAIRKGIVKGYVDGTFKPNASITRAEFTVMLMNALQTEYTEANLSFTDRSKIGDWAQSAIARAVQAGFIQGDTDGAFRPNEAVTRAEMAVMVASALQLKAESGTGSPFADDELIPLWARASVAGLQKSGLLNGKGLNNFAPRDNTTRAEAVKLLLSMPK
ncbi:InlB B-repeat-containing protein [Paenibacillus sp. JNUCC31]|uniref:InlB B-repeat-containing protein n=1 Tax=Paenibacillus sp. JNUCC-31 TaxID=2777983 RepID=UPI00177CB339|nr:InlB B-repeat-containing protein [Paenibacillus sp. JNUCC-31]QOS81642.1 InlB B-repeat-containing protein [Paenibacillus sp. JNUCC-31]